MGKRARRAAPVVSRSGLWLIGGALLVSAAVLAWAFQGDSAPRTAHAIRRPVAAPSPTSRHVLARAASDRDAAASPGEEMAQRPPAAADYGSLLQSDAFQPRVVVRKVRAANGSASGKARHPAPRPAATSRPAGPEKTGEWQGWKYTGIAQLDRKTYALMDQPNKKQSRFVGVGDHLDDAVVASVAEDEVALRVAGSLVRVQRVDTTADLLRPSRPATVLPQGPVTAGATPPVALSAPGPAGSFTASPGAQPPAAATAGGADQQNPGGRRGRRFRQPDGAGFPGLQ